MAIAVARKFLSQYLEFVDFQNISRSIKFNLTTNDDWDEGLEVEPDEDLEVEPDEEWDSDSGTYSFSAKLFTRREELLKLVSAKNGTKHTLFVEGEDNEIVITYLFGEEKLVTVWNRSTALEVAEAIQYYFSA